MSHYSHRAKQRGKHRAKQRAAAFLIGAGSAAGLVLAVPGAASAAPSPSVSCTPNVVTVTCTYAYSYTGSAQTFTPLPGVTSIFVALTGGQGGTGGTYSGGGAGGAGGKGAAVTGSRAQAGRKTLAARLRPNLLGLADRQQPRPFLRRARPGCVRSFWRDRAQHRRA